MKRIKNWWIKERYNPQIGMYYVPMGQMSKKAAKKHEKSLYGENTMIPFDTEEKYQDEIYRLRITGESVQ